MTLSRMKGLSIGLPLLLVALAGCATSAVEVVQVIEQPLVVEEDSAPGSGTGGGSFL